MKKRPFLLFLLILSAWVAAAIVFIQSPRFASIFKKAVARYVPGDLGIDADFSELAIQLFPPGVSIKNPKIAVRDRNILKMPAGTSVQAERIDLNFRLFEALSGDIRIHEVVIVNGDATLVLASMNNVKASKKNFDLRFHWDELLQVRAETIALRNTQMHLVWKRDSTQKSDPSLDFVARSLRLSQWSGQGGLGYEAEIHLRQIRSTFNEELVQGIRIPAALDEIKALARVNQAGASLQEFSVNAQGLEVQSHGKIKGDVLSIQAKKEFGLELRAEGDLKKIGSFIDPSLSGRGVFTGNLHGSLDSKLNSYRAEGHLEVRDFKFQEWNADRISLDGSWIDSPNGGEVAVAGGKIIGRETERVLRHGKAKPAVPGSGGEIEIGAFKLNPRLIQSQSARLSIPLSLKKAQLHWLAGPGARSVFSLLFRASGPVNLTWDQRAKSEGQHGWQVELNSSLTLTDFQLDNQSTTEDRPLHRVLKIPKLVLRGTTVVNSEMARPSGVIVEVGRSKLKVDGKFDFKKGFDLHANGGVSLADLGELAETPIRGDGSLSLRVHGPASNVILDFDVDLENSSYLNMNFGSLKGRMTWDDHPNHLLLIGIKAAKNQTPYSVNGLVDLGDRSSIDLRIKVPGGNVRDLNEIFSNMTQGFWWFPHTVAGAVDGDITVSGGVDLKELQVKAVLNGKNWDFLGERIDRVTLSGGYDQGLYYLQDIHALKHNGKISGRISFLESQKKFDWEFQTQQLTVTDFDRLAQLDVPIRGKIMMKSVGNGRQDRLESETQVALTDVSVRGSPLPPSRLFLKSAGGKLEVKGNALGGQGLLDASYDFTLGKQSALRAEFNHIDFTPILLLLNPRILPDAEVGSYGSGLVNLSFNSGTIERANGDVSLTEFSLKKTGTAFKLVHPVSFNLVDGSFDLKGVSLANQRGGEATLRLKSANTSLEGTISGTLDVSIAEFLTSSVSQASGMAHLDFAIGGIIKEPTLVGRGTLDSVAFRVPSVESPFENLTGAFQLKQNHLVLDDLQADLAGGRLRGGGEITLFADRYPQLDLLGSIHGAKVKVPPFQFVKIGGNLKVSGDQLPYSVDGLILVESALLKENMLQQKASSSLQAVRFTPPPSLNRMTDYPKFKLNIDVKSEGGILVQNDLFDADLKAQLKVINTIEAPRILGSVDVLHGKMIFKNRRFQIQSATAVFDNPTLLNPRFNLSATTDVSWVKVQLYASGRIGDEVTRGNQEKWKIELSSTPLMPESDIISLLALGMTASESKKLNSSDRAVFEQGEAASLLLHSLDFNREVESKTGLQIQLDESVNSQDRMSVSRPQAAGNESGLAPKIVIRKQLSKNLDLSYGSTVGVGASSQRQVSAEVKLNPGLSVLGVWDTYQGSEAKDRRTSYGLDLKVQKRFK